MTTKKYTPEELANLAKNMYVPIRCGGSWTEERQIYYIFMGCKLTGEQFNGLQDLTSEQLNNKIKEYREQGIITDKPYFVAKGIAILIVMKRATLEQCIKLYKLTDEEVSQVNNLLLEHKNKKNDW